MKRFVFCIFSLLLTACAAEPFAPVDEAIRHSAEYDKAVEARLDSLKKAAFSCPDDWDGILKLYEIYSHYQYDSCHRYARRLVTLAGTDPDRKVIAGAALARTTHNLGSTLDAVTLLEQIDTSAADMSGIAGRYWYVAGERIYGALSNSRSGVEVHKEKRARCAAAIKSLGVFDIESVYIRYHELAREKKYEEAIALVEKFRTKKMTSNEFARSSFYLAELWGEAGNRDRQIEYLNMSAVTDLHMGIKTYNSLYNIAMMEYANGRYEQASRHIRKSLEDATFSNYNSRLLRSPRIVLMFSESLHREDRDRRFLLIAAVLIVLLILSAFAILYTRTRKHSRELEVANASITDLSQIKDTFLAQYMEIAADYIGKVDEFKSEMRRTARKEGTDALLALLRTPPYADSEYVNYYRNFDKAFLGIYPSFVKQVNDLMLPGQELKEPADGTLSSELRILALIRLGITDRPRIAKVLHISLGTVYVYLSNIRHASTLPGPEFEQRICTLG